ncbi:MAG: hypothetical protein KIT43_04040 [Bauldia sp.]|nr:hypothetical protein [Bauldia sp.]
MSTPSARSAQRDAMAGSLTLAGLAMIAVGAVLWLLTRDLLDWMAALFLAWGIAGGFILFGNAVIEVLHLGRREPVPVRVRVDERRR